MSWPTMGGAGSPITVSGGDLVGSTKTATVVGGTGTIQWAHYNPTTGAYISDITGETGTTYVLEESDGGFIVGAYLTNYQPFSHGTTPVPVVRLASASNRLMMNSGSATAGANNVRCGRFGDIPKATLTNPKFRIAPSTRVDSTVVSGPQEVNTNAVVPVRGALLTDLTLDGGGIPVRNQSAATYAEATWFNFANAVAGYSKKPDGTNPTAGEFAAAGGLISGDGKQLTVPIGWYGESDEMTITLTKGQIYLTQYETACAVGSTYAIGSITTAHPNLGDAGKDNATTGQAVFQKNWDSLTGVSGTPPVGPLSVVGTSVTGAYTVGVAGDSIARENSDRVTQPSGQIFGDVNGVTAFARRALSLAGYCSVNVAINGANAANPFTYDGFNVRSWLLGICQAVIHNIGNNDRGLSWATFQPYWRSYNNRMRAACNNGAGSGRVVAIDWPPQATSTDLWATTANQSANQGPGSMQYDTFNPFIQAGVFNVGAGDCDAGYSMNKAIYDLAAANGATDIDALKVKWPANGASYAWAADLTHPTSLPHAYVAADLAPKLPALLGFNAST